MPPTLPIEDVLPEITEAVCRKPVTILTAPPGSGKTTVVPLELLKEEWLHQQKILMLEPRRLAARLAAHYMAGKVHENVGQSVGYQVRFDKKIGKDTRLEVLTEGILTRRLQQDPELTGVRLVIFDEFHERSLESDLALALCLDVVHGLREDLRILIMSATLDSDTLSKMLGGAPVVTGKGFSHPVEMHNLSTAPSGCDFHRPEHIVSIMDFGIRRALNEQEGDILAFLPGSGEIRRTKERLADLASDEDLALYPLYGDLSPQDQELALMPDKAGRRRIILATNVAETSLTIEGISIVVDSGWRKVARFDPNSGLTRLVTSRISKASATQRSGRAGRLGPGYGYRLWNKGVEHSMMEHDRPEIMEADLSQLLLELTNWGINDPTQLQWLDLPPAGSIASASDLLRELQAIDTSGAITAMGKEMVALPAHPRLAHMLVMGKSMGFGNMACDITAILSERDLIRDRDASVDIEERLHALNAFRKSGAKAAMAMGAAKGSCRRVEQTAKQLRKRLNIKKSDADGSSSGGLIALAFPDRVAQLRPGSKNRYKLNSGRGAALKPHDPLAGSPFLAIAAMDAARAEGPIYLAARIGKEEIFEEFDKQLEHKESVEWNAKTGAVTAKRQTILGELILKEKPIKNPEPQLLQDAMLQGIREAGIEILPWTKKARSLQARLICINEWQPKGEWPDVSDTALTENLADWLPPFLSGNTGKGQLAKLDMQQIILSMLDWSKQQRLDKEAPTHLTVPSGSRIPLRYTPGEAPILAVRLQEMFGLADTPTIAGGKVKVMLHLLSPAQRPLQVTQDLKGFWDGSYHEVKKEMKGRYPKHHWPDDPWQCKPTRRAKTRVRDSKTNTAKTR